MPSGQFWINALQIWPCRLFDTQRVVLKLTQICVPWIQAMVDITQDTEDTIISNNNKIISGPIICFINGNENP